MQICTYLSLNHLTCICRENDYQLYTVSTSQPRQSQVRAMYYNVIIIIILTVILFLWYHTTFHALIGTSTCMHMYI